jgi:hypothetical protein
MNLTEVQITAYAKHFEEELFAKPLIAFSRDKTWTAKNFDSAAGIYAIYDKGALIYIGESANVKLRMQEVKRTYNHTLKKILNNLHFKAKLKGNKFSDVIELKLNQYMLDHVTFKAKSLAFGRLEMEAMLIERNLRVKNKKNKRNKTIK